MRRRKEAGCPFRFFQRVECGVKQFADATTVHGGNAIRLPQTHLPEFGGQVFAFAIIDLVHRKRHRLAGGTEHFDDAFVRVGEANQTVHHENHGIGKLHGDLRLGCDGGFDAFHVGFPAARVDQFEIGAAPFGVVAHTVASHAGGVLHHGCATAENTVHQSGFADVRTSDHGKYADRFRTILAFATRERRSIDQLLIAFIQLIAFEVGNVLAVFLFLDGVVNDTDEHVKGLAEVEIGVVDGQHAFRGGCEVGDFRIGLVACRDIFHTHTRGGLSATSGLTDLFTRGKQDAHFGVGSDDGGDITALSNNTGAFGEGIDRSLSCDVGTLRGDQHVTHGDDVGHLGHVRRDLGRTDGLADVLVIGVHLRIVRIDADVEMAVGEEFADGFGDELLIDGFGIQIDAFVHAPPGAGTVHRACVEVCETIIFGQCLGRG